jgi:hypothetical protein
MSDCALAIRNSIATTYEDLGEGAPNHYWCWFHVLKALKGQAVSHLHDRLEEAINHFKKMMHLLLDPPADVAQLVSKWSTINPGFADYIVTQYWQVNLKHWPCFYRMVRTTLSSKNIEQSLTIFLGYAFCRQPTRVSTPTTTPRRGIRCSNHNTSLLWKNDT